MSWPVAVGDEDEIAGTQVNISEVRSETLERVCTNLPLPSPDGR